MFACPVQFPTLPGGGGGRAVQPVWVAGTTSRCQSWQGWRGIKDQERSAVFWLFFHLICGVGETAILRLIYPALYSAVDAEGQRGCLQTNTVNMSQQTAQQHRTWGCK